MKLYKSLTILGIFLVLIVVGFFVGRELIARNTPQPIFRHNPVIANYRSADVEEVTIYNEGMVMNLRLRDEVTTKDDGTRQVSRIWYLVGEENVRLNQQRVQGLIIHATSLSGRTVVEENPEDLEMYGLTGNYAIQIRTVQGLEYRLLLGDLLFDRDGFYIMREGVDIVYAISVYPVLQLYATRADLLDLNIFPTRNVLEVERFSLIRNQVHQFSITAHRHFVWMMQEPIVCKAKIPVVDRAIRNTIELSRIEFVDKQPEDLSEYGLDTPSYEITITSAGRTTTLLIGWEDIRTDVFYAMVKGEEGVFTVSSQTLDFLDSPVMDMILEYQYTPDLSLIKYIDFQTQDMQLRFEIGFNEQLQLTDYRFNNQSINRLDRNLIPFGVFFFQSAILVPITSIVPVWDIVGEPFLTMTVHFEDGFSDIIEYYEKDSQNSYFVRNGSYLGFTVCRNYLHEETGFIRLIELIYTGELQKEFGITN